MTKFLVFAEQIETGRKARFFYDNATSELTDEQGQPVPIPASMPVQKFNWSGAKPAHAISKDAPGIKVRALRKLKIQLGLNCNYDCGYCNQRASLSVSGRTVSGPEHVAEFVDCMPSWFDGEVQGDGSGVQIEFWGGEPLVYWKTLKPLAEAIRQKYPRAQFSVITNGSLLDAEKVEWLDALGFSVGISHDGPGHKARGPDPLDDDQARAAIVMLIERLAPQGRVSINSMVHKDNPSRAALNAWMVERFGPGVQIGEGGFIDPYDSGGLAQSVPNQQWAREFSKHAFLEMRRALVRNMQIASSKVMEFIESVATKRPACVLGQKCGMDRPDHMAVDLAGNVLTCQNTSAAAIAPNGQSHALGSVADLDAARLATATHWSHRPDCPNCPVLQLCKGSCMFLEGELWDKGCDNAFADNIAFWAAGFEALTGFAPVFIDGHDGTVMREDRKDIFGLAATTRADEHVEQERQTIKPSPRPTPIQVLPAAKAPVVIPIHPI